MDADKLGPPSLSGNLPWPTNAYHSILEIKKIQRK